MNNLQRLFLAQILGTPINMNDYPLLTRYGFEISYDETKGPPGIEHEHLKATMIKLGKWDAWCKWSRGNTLGMNGDYPWDVERFLGGKQSDD